jgi:hypothetical protein
MTTSRNTFPDLGVNQVIVSEIVGTTMAEKRKELYSSANGDKWFLERRSDGWFVIHQPNEPSGGHTSRVPVDEFIQRGSGPEVMAVRRALADATEAPFDESAMERVMRDCPL